MVAKMKKTGLNKGTNKPNEMKLKYSQNLSCIISLLILVDGLHLISPG